MAPSVYQLGRGQLHTRLSLLADNRALNKSRNHTIVKDTAHRVIPDHADRHIVPHIIRLRWQMHITEAQKMNWTNSPERKLAVDLTKRLTTWLSHEYHPEQLSREVLLWQVPSVPQQRRCPANDISDQRTSLPSTMNTDSDQTPCSWLRLSTNGFGDLMSLREDAFRIA